MADAAAKERPDNQPLEVSMDLGLPENGFLNSIYVNSSRGHAFLNQPFFNKPVWIIYSILGGWSGELSRISFKIVLTCLKPA